MKFLSTRGNVRNLTFEEALFSGYVSDGGLLVPENIPSVSETTWRKWSTLSYLELCKTVLRLFIDSEEIPTDELNALIENVLVPRFPEEVIPIRNLEDDLAVMELWHGPTYTFKDLGLSCVAQLMNYFLTKRQKNCIALVLTTGDTGSAAIESVHGLPSVDIIVLYPSNNRISHIQELQMITYPDENVHVYAADGNADEFTYVLQHFMQDEEFSREHGICAMNSLNIARVLVQCIHYIYGYFKTCKDFGQPARFIVPTGGAGNITAGYLVQKMGLPIKIISAVNACANLVSFFADGTMERDREVLVSVSPALDGEIPYNVERILYFECNCDSDLVTKLMREFEQNGALVLPEELKHKIQSFILPAKTPDSDAISAIFECWKQYHYAIDPHTAVAVSVVFQERKTNSRLFSSVSGPTVCLATASTVKFSESLEKADVEFQIPEKITSLESKPKCYKVLSRDEDWKEAVKQCIEEITKRKRKERNV